MCFTVPHVESFFEWRKIAEIGFDVHLQQPAYNLGEDQFACLRLRHHLWITSEFMSFSLAQQCCVLTRYASPDAAKW
jgi:hypothetical protein